MAVSAMTPDHKSIRSKDQQITENRFSPEQFDANVQTDKKLIDIYVEIKKED